MNMYYCINRYPSGFSKNANIWQKLAMFSKAPICKIIDFSKEKLPRDTQELICYETMSFANLLRVCFWRIFYPKRRYVMMFWDPPGMFRLDGRAMRDRIQCWFMNVMVEFAGRGAEKLVWNLHPGFVKSTYSISIFRKCSFFPNGTLVTNNRLYSKRVSHFRKRVAVNSAFTAIKGCWEITEIFINLWRNDHDVSLIWIGYHGIEDEVREKLKNAGIPDDNVIIPGYVSYDTALELLASADVALCYYHDKPSIRWNYVLKAPEFMSLGIPMIAPDLFGIQEYVQNGITGCLFKAGDKEMAFRELRELVNNAEKITYMREQCLATATKYDWCKINDSILSELKKINYKGGRYVETVL